MTECCIAGCGQEGIIMIKYQWYCHEHSKELNVDSSVTKCCIAGCANTGVAKFKDRLYCRYHLDEERLADTTPAPFTPYKCSVHECFEQGVITQSGTGKHFCIDHAWQVDRPLELEEAEIKEKIPNSDKPPTPKTLDDVGRRYEHLMDLRDVWEGGLYTLSRIRPAYISKADEILKASLTTALNLLNKQIDSMSGIDHKLFEIRKRIDG